MNDADVLLSDFAPRSHLVAEEHPVTRARFTAIDAHHHPGRWLSRDGAWMVSDVSELFRVLDGCNITAIVNLDGMWGDVLEANLDRYDRAAPGRVFTFAQSELLRREPGLGRSHVRDLPQLQRRHRRAPGRTGPAALLGQAAV